MVKKSILNGAKSFIVKPFKEEQLIETLNKVMFI
ncbi:MAG TPA: response regulator, partial [Clostridium sp.]|nr:response regulator [Clostridium sp.]